MSKLFTHLMRGAPILLFLNSSVWAQSTPEITGPSSICPGIEYTYRAYNTVTYPCSFTGNSQWTVTGGTITEQNTQSCKIIWNSYSSTREIELRYRLTSTGDCMLEGNDVLEVSSKVPNTPPVTPIVGISQNQYCTNPSGIILGDPATYIEIGIANSGFGIMYIWELSINGGVYNVVSTTSGDTIEFPVPSTTVNELDVYQFRAKAFYTECNNIESIYGYTSPIYIYPRAPKIDNIAPNAPECPSENGNVTVYHNIDTPIGAVFNYTFTQYFKGELEDCYQQGDDNKLTDSLLATAENFGIILEEGFTYCKGFIGNITHTFNGGDLNVTFTEGDILGEVDEYGDPIPNQTNQNEVKFTAGIYEVEIESKSAHEDDFSGCLSRYFIEIPESTYDTIKFKQILSSTAPFCKGDTSGALNIELESGLGDITWKIFKDGDSITSSTVSEKIFNTGRYLGSENHYNLKITDQCVEDLLVRQSIQLNTDGPLVTSQISNHTDPTCNENGTLTVFTNSIAEKEGYSFELYTSGGSTGIIMNTVGQNDTIVTFTELGAANFHVRVRTEGCDFNESDTQTLNKIDRLTLNTTATSPTCSNVNDGSFTITNISKPEDHEINFEYTLSGPGYSKTDVVEASDVLPNNLFEVADDLDAGIYTISIDDLCSSEIPTINNASRTLIKDDQITLAPQPDQFLRCYGNMSKPVTITWTAGTGPFNLIVNKNGSTVHTINSTTDRFAEIGSLEMDRNHPYEVTLKDLCGGTDVVRTNEFWVTSNASSLLTISNVILRNKPNGKNVSCPGGNDGETWVYVRNGVSDNTKGYYEVWITDQDSNIINHSNISVLTNDIRFEFSGLSPDVAYTAYVRDYNEDGSGERIWCEKSENFVLDAPSDFALPTVDESWFNDAAEFEGEIYIACNDRTRGNIYYTGGNEADSINLIYKSDLSDPKWVNYETINDSYNFSLNSRVFELRNLRAGYFRYNIIDEYGCESGIIPDFFELKNSSDTLSIDSLFIDTKVHGLNVSCYNGEDGRLFTEVSGGLGIYDYWLQKYEGTNGPYIENVNITNNKSANSHEFNNVQARGDNGDLINYVIMVRDEVGCRVSSLPIAPRIILSQPDSLIATIDISSRVYEDDFEITCNGGDAEVNIRSTGGTYDHIVKLTGYPSDKIESNSDSVQFHLPTGTYSFEISDDYGCSFTIDTTFNEPDNPLEFSSVSAQHGVCWGNEATINASATGGSAYSGNNYWFKIRNFTSGGTWGEDSIFGNNVQFYRTNGTLGLDTIEFEIEVTDRFYCSEVYLIESRPNPNPLTLVVNSSQPPNCNSGTDGYISVTASNFDEIGGTDLIFSITGGHFTDTLNVTRNVIVSGPTWTFEDLHDTNDYPSAYNLWVTDDNGCPVNITYDLYEDNIKLPAPDTLNISLNESIRPSCFNGADGNITLFGSGGVGSYRFIFKGDTTSIAGNQFFLGTLEEGKYAFSLIDTNYQVDQPTCLYRDSFEIHPGRIIDLTSDVTNVTCFQGNDGTIDLSVDILNRPAAESVDPDSLFLFWVNDLNGDTLSTHEDLFGLEAASYTVKAQYNMDSTACLNEERIVVGDPDVPFTISSLTVYNSQCGTSNSGRVILSITGGYANVKSEYRLNSDSWIQFDGASVLINSIDIGDYLLEVRQVGTDCPDINEFSIAEGMLSLEIDKIITPSCNGNNDGEVHLTFDESGLVFALVGNSFLANNGVFTGLSAGDYKFVARKIADAGCESDTLNVTISEPAQLLVSLDSITIADCDQSNGTASASATGGTGIYSFSWKDISGVNANPQNLIPGEYTVTVTDENGCSNTTPFTIGNNPNLSLSYTIMDTADCDYPNGSATLIITDGVAPFNLNGVAGLTETSILLESMIEGDTLITVSDERGCSNDIVITVPTQNTLSVILDDMIQTTCGEANGSLSVSVSGGTPPYSFTWDGFDTTANTLTDLSVGSYDLTVSDAHGCTITDTYDVTPADGVSSVSYWISDPFCEQQTGSITITNVSGDFPPYHVKIVFDGSTSNTGTYDLSESELIIPDLGAGNYALEVIDDNGCLFPVGGIILTDDPNYIPTVEASLIDSSACGLAVGEASVTVSGGQSPHSFSWVDADEIDLGITSDLASELARGEYTATVIDGLGCFNNDEVIIVDRDAPLIQLINTTPSPVGANNGSATVQAENGGGASFTYSLDGEGVNMVNTTGNFTELPPGTYHAFANDVFGCITNTINFDISATAGLEVRLLSIIDATCQSASDAFAQVGVSGGISPYSLFWDGTLGTESQSDLSIGDHWVIVEDAIGSLDSLFFSIDYLTPISMEVFASKASCPGTCDGSIDMLVSYGSGSHNVLWEHGATGVSLDDLCPGSYRYTITDVANDECIYSGEVVIDQYEDLSISQIESVAPTCFDGTNGFVSVHVSGGSGSYAYSWENGDTDNRLNAVTPGTYTLTISDNILGCSITSSFEIPQTLAIDLSDIAVTPPSCSGGDNGVIVIALANASSPRIIWDNGQIGTRATGLSAGTYQFEVLDAKGCTFSGEVEMEEKPELVVNEDTSNPLCFGDCTGTIDLEISGGETPYFVAWTHGPRNLSLEGLCAGSYHYTITDKFGCGVSGSVDITSPEQLEVSLNQFFRPSCNGDDDGSVSVSVSGGVADYDYEWSNGAVSAVNSNISAGNYTLLVTDKNECSANFNYHLQEPPTLLINDATITHPSCPQTEDGQITVSAIGGTSPYTFTWNDGVNSQNRTGLVEGNYLVTIRDDQGCEYARNFRLRNPNGLEIVNIKENDPQCFGDENGSITLEVYGGSSPYTFLWDNGSTSQNLTGIGENSYNLTVSDANDCNLSQNFGLENPPKPKVAGLPESTLVCTGGSAILEPESDWKFYNWKGPNGFSAISKRIEVTEEGDYTLVATDANDCRSEPHTSMIEVGDNILDAEILRLSEAIAFEPIVFVDISLPVPEKIEWVIPDDPDIIINNESQANVELVFLESRNYEIGLRATIGTCESEIYKNIVVKEPTEEDKSTNGRRAPKIRVDIFPNPAKEIVSIKVRAESREMIDLIMLSNLDHRTIIHEQLNGSYDYLLKLDISQLESGVYLLYIKQANHLSSKLIVVR